MLNIDPDSRAVLRNALSKLANQMIEGLSTGNFYDANGNFSVGKYERERGVITGIGLALSLLENDPATPKDELSEENENGSTED